MRFLNGAFLLFILFYSCSSLAQDSLQTFKHLKIYPLPAVGYAPETRWYAGGVALFNMRFTNDSIEKPSSVKTEFNITQNKQWVAYLGFDIRPNKEKYIISGLNGYYEFPEDYWGVGAASSEDNKVSYDASRLEIDNSFMIRSGKRFYSGVRFRYHNMLVKNYDPELNIYSDNDQRYVTGGPGISLLYDSRDNVFTPSSGNYLFTSILFFDPLFGGNYSFQRIDVDARTYMKLHMNGLLALQLKSSVNFGAAPFRMLPLAGSETILRGYYTGRYRDDFLITTQIEYRTAIWRWVGVAAFVGGGRGFNSQTTNFSETLLPNYGLGLRLRVDKNDNINLRFDYGIGKNADGFYVAFAEAF